MSKVNILRENYYKTDKKYRFYFRRRMMDECRWKIDRTFYLRLNGSIELTPAEIRVIGVIMKEIEKLSTS